MCGSMIELHVHIEEILVVSGMLVCSALLLAKLVLLAYRDLRQTWRDLDVPHGAQECRPAEK